MNSVRFPFTFTGAALAAWLFGSCGSMQSAYSPPAPVPLMPPVAFDAPAPNHQASGSLWTPQSGSLWSDPVARNVTDIVFVNVREDSNASSTADTELSRDSNIDLGIPNLFGHENEWDTINDDDPSSGVDPTHLLRANSTNNTNTEAETIRRGKLTARVSAQVVQVFPNGNMRLYGTQVVSVNNENQLLTVEGIARPYDVQSDNSIDSFLLAEARISFSGRGVVSDYQRPGWGSRAANWAWPF